MPTLAGVIRSVFPGAVALGPGGAGRPPRRRGVLAVETAAQPVGWVRVMRARVPAFDALEAGDLVIVPEGALRALIHEPTDAQDVAEELRRAQVTAVVYLPQAGAPKALAASPDAPAAFIGEVLDRSVPVFRLDDADEGPLERAAIGYLVNERGELERQVARLESDLRAIALEGRGLEAMAAAIAGFLKRSVAIEDVGGAVVALHAPLELPAAAVAAARYEANQRAAALRVDLPGGGALALLGEDPPSELEQAAGDRIALALAFEFARDAASHRAHDRRFDALPAEGPPWVVIMARQALSGAEVPFAEREERRERVRRLAPARRLLLRGDAASVELRGVAAAVPADPLGLELGARIAAALGRPVAVSRPFDDPTGRPPADAEARALLEAADELASVQPPPPVLRADRLAVYRMLGSLHNLPDAQRHGHALLEPLRVGTPRAQRERLATLRAILDSAGQGQASARLRVHRNTLAYRVRRIEELTGWDLRDPDLRMVLGLALRIVQSHQS